MTQEEYAIVVAGGKGTRFRSSTPKQFLELNGKPVLLHTLEAFFQYSPGLAVILVLPADDIPVWNDLAGKHGFRHPLVIQSGGQSRFQSVRKGLEKIQGEGLVAVHDGVRPLVTPELIAASFRHATVHHSAVCAVPLKESLRMINPSAAEWQAGSRAVDRAAFRLIQTPQTFDVGMLKKAYEVVEDSAMTDDASVFERAGHTVFLFEGRYDNIKITTSEDLVVAEALMRFRRL